MADAMKLVSIDQMRSAGFRVGLVSTHGNPAGTWGYTSPFGATGKGYAREEQAWAAASDVFLREKEEAQAYFSFSASPPAREEAPAIGDGPERALQDAVDFGIGFLVDGERVSPDRVTVVRGEEAPAKAGELADAIKRTKAYRKDAHPKHKTMFVNIVDLDLILNALRAQPAPASSEAVAWRVRWRPSKRSEPGPWREPMTDRPKDEDFVGYEIQPLYLAPPSPDADRLGGGGIGEYAQLLRPPRTRHDRRSEEGKSGSPPSPRRTDGGEVMPRLVEQTATVFRSPTKGRRYFTARGAAMAEAGALIAKKYPTESPEYHDGRMTYAGFHHTLDDRLVRVRKRLARSIERSATSTQEPSK